ncbi:hypothetical protein CEXT_696351 [Caerostris extrusa]|uniref:Maturase K n=1 Tax=Caerostris extrusa TaxID=172846 RepID=A0AAV4YE41_CAEEX|nr:hypothetical protein CEXT_696351 [Caerostris extrusa]
MCDIAPNEMKSLFREQVFWPTSTRPWLQLPRLHIEIGRLISYLSLRDEKSFIISSTSRDTIFSSHWVDTLVWSRSFQTGRCFKEALFGYKYLLIN